MRSLEEQTPPDLHTREQEDATDIDLAPFLDAMKNSKWKNLYVGDGHVAATSFQFFWASLRV